MFCEEKLTQIIIILCGGKAGLKSQVCEATMFYYWQQKVEMYETKIIFSSF
jgi:hypothetical protein